MDRDVAGSWQLPQDLEPLWKVLEKDDRERTGRKALSLRNIVAAGVELADREGLPEVTMARIAANLGFSTMALYRHLPSKSVLLVLMVDAAIGEPPSLPDGGAWRDTLESLAWRLADIYRLHPWLLDVPISGPPATPNNVRWMEAGMASFRGTSLPDADRLGIWMLLAVFVRGQSLLALQLERGRAGMTGNDSYAAILRRLTGAPGFPEVSRVIASGMFDDMTSTREENDAEFAFGLALFLDGTAAHLDRAQESGSDLG